MSNNCSIVDENSSQPFTLASTAHGKETPSCPRWRESGKYAFPVAFLATAVFVYAAPDQLLPTYSKLPLAFEENRGQAPAGANYLSRTRNGVVLLRQGGVALQSQDGKSISMAEWLQPDFCG